jgi:hypothetical protein
MFVSHPIDGATYVARHRQRRAATSTLVARVRLMGLA